MKMPCNEELKGLTKYSFLQGILLILPQENGAIIQYYFKCFKCDWILCFDGSLVSFCESNELHFPPSRKASYPITSKYLRRTSFTSCYCQVLEFISVHTNTNQLTLVSLFGIYSEFATNDDREHINLQFSHLYALVCAFQSRVRARAP